MSGTFEEWNLKFFYPQIFHLIYLYSESILCSHEILCLYCVVCCPSLSVTQTLIEVWWTKYFLSIIDIVSLDVIRKELTFDICTALVRLVGGQWSRVWWLLHLRQITQREHPEVPAGLPPEENSLVGLWTMSSGFCRDVLRMCVECGADVGTKVSSGLVE